MEQGFPRTLKTGRTDEWRAIRNSRGRYGMSSLLPFSLRSEGSRQRLLSRESSLNLKGFRWGSYVDHGVRRLKLAGPGTIQGIRPNKGITGLDHKCHLFMQPDVSYLAWLSFSVFYFWY